MWKSAALIAAVLGLSLAAAPDALAWRSSVVIGGYWGGGYYPQPYYYGPPPAYYAPPVVIYQQPAPPPAVIYQQSPPPPVVYQQSAPVVDAAPMGPVYRDRNTGQYCREYQSTLMVAGQPQRGYGTACQQADGTWRIVQ